MSKAEVLRELESFSREDLDEVADRVDQLRGGEITAQERALLQDRIAQYRANPEDLVDLDDAVADILKKQK